MKKEVVENTVTVGSIVIAGACLMTGNCQIGVFVLGPVSVYHMCDLAKELLCKKRK